MLSALVALFEFIMKAVSWVHDAGQRALGGNAQFVTDEAVTINKQAAIDRAAANAPINRDAVIEKLMDGEI